MKGADIESAVLLVHPAFVDQKLFLSLSCFSVIVEFYSFHKLCFIVSIRFISFYHRHVTLLRLNNIHRQVLQVLLFISSLQETLHFYCVQVVTIRVLGLKVVTR